MQLNGFLAVFGVACLGGVLLELYKWYGLRESASFPHYVRSPFYWAVTVAMILAGGALATLYGTDDVNALLALNIGVSAPAILRTIAANVPDLGGETDAARDVRGHDVRDRSRGSQVRPSIREFLTGR
jgi:hypothetical protein